MKKIILFILIIMIVITLYQLTTDHTIDFETIDYTLLRDGTFQGEYSTLLVHAIVEISIEEYTIKEIRIIKHDCGKGQPAETIIETMIENNNHHVDTISGATISSKIIMKAVENALKHSIERR